MAIFSGAPPVGMHPSVRVPAALCGAHGRLCGRALQIVVALLLAVVLFGITYKLCPSVLTFLAKRLPGGLAAQSAGSATDDETAPLMGDSDDIESMIM